MFAADMNLYSVCIRFHHWMWSPIKTFKNQNLPKVFVYVGICVQPIYVICVLYIRYCVFVYV